MKEEITYRELAAAVEQSAMGQSQPLERGDMQIRTDSEALGNVFPIGRQADDQSIFERHGLIGVADFQRLAVGQMNPERFKRPAVQKIADTIQSHIPIISRTPAASEGGAA